MSGLQNPLGLRAVGQFDSPFGIESSLGGLTFQNGRVNAGIDWRVVLVVIILLVIFSSCCASIMYVFRFQIYNLIKPQTLSVQTFQNVEKHQE